MTLQRNRYFTGRLLSAADFADEQEYVREKFRRLHRVALGTGVVSGLAVSVHMDGDAPTVNVSAGVAVDAAGELIEVPTDVCCALPSLVSPDALSCVVELRYVEQLAAPVASVPTTGDLAGESGHADGEPQATRIVEGFALSVAAAPDESAILLARLEFDGAEWHLAGETPDRWDGDN